MKRILFLVFLVGALSYTGCVTPEVTSVSTINQPRAVPKKYTTTTTVTETKPDGSVVTTRMTSVVVPLEDGTEKEAVLGPEVIAQHNNATDPAAQNIGNAPDPYNKTTNQVQPQTTTTTNPQVTSNSLTTTSAEPDYMQSRERDMIKEINLVRTNPKGYIKHIENYKIDIQKVKYTDIDFLERELIAADELIKELNTMAPVSALKDHKGLYNVAANHGLTIKKRGYSSHLGSDGSYPWDRISRSVPELIDGNENLVGGPESVRDAVILLLVDSGIQGRGHRKTLLQKDWQYVACYEVGEVGGIKNYWVQNFAKSGTVPVTSPSTSAESDPDEDFGLTSSINQPPRTSIVRPNTTVPATNTTTNTDNGSWGGIKPTAETTVSTRPQPTTTTTSTVTAPNPSPTTQPPPVATNPVTTTRPVTTNTVNTTAPDSPTPRANPTIEAISSTTPSPDVPVEERRFDTGRSVPYLTAREKDMILEINRARANPQRYIRYIEEYRAKVKRNNNPNSAETKEELAAIDELVRTLNSMAPVSILQPDAAVHRAAKKHGEELRSNGKVSHIGSDGSYPWDRILREDSKLKDGNENLVGGPENVRDAVILLLVDSGISGRGHRKNILNKDWKYVSCYEAGTVGRMKNNWVQNFAR